MKTTLVLNFKSVYGKTVAYPANDQARRLADLVNSKTLTYGALRDAAGMGFDFAIEPVSGRFMAITLSDVLDKLAA